MSFLKFPEKIKPWNKKPDFNLQWEKQGLLYLPKPLESLFSKYEHLIAKYDDAIAAVYRIRSECKIRFTLTSIDWPSISEQLDLSEKWFHSVGNNKDQQIVFSKAMSGAYQKLQEKVYAFLKSKLDEQKEQQMYFIAPHTWYSLDIETPLKPGAIIHFDFHPVQKQFFMNEQQLAYYKAAFQGFDSSWIEDPYEATDGDMTELATILKGEKERKLNDNKLD